MSGVQESMVSAEAMQRTPQRRGNTGGTTSTPNAKRATPLEGLLGRGEPAGPQMDASDLNNFVYRLYHDVEAMKRWGFTVNDALGDHATRLDAVRVRTVMEEIAAMKQKLEENDTSLKTKLEQNDNNIKGIVNGIADELQRKMGDIDSTKQ